MMYFYVKNNAFDKKKIKIEKKCMDNVMEF
jgi:hypothetical protein